MADVLLCAESGDTMGNRPVCCLASGCMADIQGGERPAYNYPGLDSDSILHLNMNYFIPF